MQPVPPTALVAPSTAKRPTHKAAAKLPGEDIDFANFFHSDGWEKTDLIAPVDANPDTESALSDMDNDPTESPTGKPTDAGQPPDTDTRTDTALSRQIAHVEPIDPGKPGADTGALLAPETVREPRVNTSEPVATDNPQPISLNRGHAKPDAPPLMAIKAAIARSDRWPDANGGEIDAIPPRSVTVGQSASVPDRVSVATPIGQQPAASPVVLQTDSPTLQTRVAELPQPTTVALTDNGFDAPARMEIGTGPQRPAIADAPQRALSMDSAPQVQLPAKAHVAEALTSTGNTPVQPRDSQGNDAMARTLPDPIGAGHSTPVSATLSVTRPIQRPLTADAPKAMVTVPAATKPDLVREPTGINQAQPVSQPSLQKASPVSIVPAATIPIASQPEAMHFPVGEAGKTVPALPSPPDAKAPPQIGGQTGAFVAFPETQVRADQAPVSAKAAQPALASAAPAKQQEPSVSAPVSRGPITAATLNMPQTDRLRKPDDAPLPHRANQPLPAPIAAAALPPQASAAPMQNALPPPATIATPSASPIMSHPVAEPRESHVPQQTANRPVIENKPGTPAPATFAPNADAPVTLLQPMARAEPIISTSVIPIETERTSLGIEVVKQLSGTAPRAPDAPIEIVLKPAELGRVKLVLSLADAAPVLHVTTDRPETLDLIRRHVEMLVQEYRNQGYHGLTVTLGGDQQSGFATGQHAHRHAQAPLPATADSTTAPQATTPQAAPPRLGQDRLDIRL